jgi:hypothetical protein
MRLLLHLSILQVLVCLSIFDIFSYLLLPACCRLIFTYALVPNALDRSILLLKSDCVLKMLQLVLLLQTGAVVLSLLAINTFLLRESSGLVESPELGS